jgi:hypothetical protein
MNKTNKIRIGVTSSILATVILSFSAYAQDVKPEDGSFLTRTMDNLPKEKGAGMANDIAGENLFETKKTFDAPVGADGVAMPAMPVTDTDGNSVSLEDETAVEREPDENGDPITQRAIRLLDESGVIGRQRAMSESIIIMDQQLQFNAKIEELLIALGPDASIEVSPGVFATYKDTPAAIRAKIEHFKLQKELSDSIAEVSGASSTETGLAGVKVDASGIPIVPQKNASVDGSNLPVRNDGTDFQQFDVTPVPVPTGPTPPDPVVADQITDLLANAERRLAEREAQILRNVSESGEVVAKRTASDLLASQAESSKTDISGISLREIYGAAGVFAAIIDVAGERMEVRVKDDIAGYRVNSIGPDYIELQKDGSSTRISF